jgi:hypothetical protein
VGRDERGDPDIIIFVTCSLFYIDNKSIITKLPVTVFAGTVFAGTFEP